MSLYLSNLRLIYPMQDYMEVIIIWKKFFMRRVVWGRGVAYKCWALWNVYKISLHCIVLRVSLCTHIHTQYQYSAWYSIRLHYFLICPLLMQTCPPVTVQCGPRPTSWRPYIGTSLEGMDPTPPSPHPGRGRDGRRRGQGDRG